jgi:hypothetical protein
MGIEGEHNYHDFLSEYNFYMIDLICDADLQAFYESLGMQSANGMIIRNYQHQFGKK